MRYLGDLDLHPGLERLVWGGGRAADVLVMGVPSHGLRAALRGRAGRAAVDPDREPGQGTRAGTRLRPTEVIDEVLPGHPAGVLSGPNLAREVLAGYAAAAVWRCPTRASPARSRPCFASRVFRVYTATDVLGCELGGVLKNVIAIAAGMAEGLGVGDNTRAMVITRGLAEMTRLGGAMGGEPVTFAGLTGLGDLMATCMSPLSRNRRVGESSPGGRTIAEITAAMNRSPRASRPPGVIELGSSTGSRCRSPPRSTRWSTRAAPPKTRSGACAGCSRARRPTPVNQNNQQEELADTDG